MVKIFFILGVILLLLAYPAQALAATLSLSPQSGTFNSGCNFSLEVILNAAGAQTDGTDAILIYDTARVSATAVSKGTIYEDYPGTNIDDSGGKITISGLASVSTPFSGNGTLATVNFTVKGSAPASATQIKFDFDPNDKTKTTDSNVVERGTIADVLSSVVDGNYTIGTGSCIAPSPSPLGRGAPATPSATVQPSPRTIDDAVGGKPGTPELTYALTIVGVVLTILGILGLAFL